jgi:hypothetical protein
VHRQYTLPSYQRWERELDRQRSSRRVASGSAAHSRIGFVFSSVASHLGESTASAPKRTAYIFASRTMLLGDRVLFPDGLAGAAETVDTPNGKYNTSEGLENRNHWRHSLRIVIHGGDFQRSRIYRVRDQEHHNDLERALCRHTRTSLSQPSQLHSCHDLGHGDFVATECTPKVRVADTQRKAIEKTILPFPRRGVDSWSIHRSGERSQEGFTFRNTTFRHFACEWSVWIVVQEGLKRVSSRESCGCGHTHHQGHHVLILGGVQLIIVCHLERNVRFGRSNL